MFAEMIRPVYAEIKHAVWGKALGEIVQSRAELRYIAHHAMAHHQVERPAGFSRKVWFLEVRLHETDPSQRWLAGLSFLSLANGFRAEVDGGNFSIFKRALEKERFGAGAASGDQCPARVSHARAVYGKNPVQGRQPPPHGAHRFRRRIRSTIVELAGEILRSHE